MEHTPIPWTTEKAPDVGILIEADSELIAIVDSECADIDTCDIAEPNAAFIVRAVNNFDKLLAALERLSASIAEDDGRWTATASVADEIMSARVQARAAIEEATK